MARSRRDAAKPVPPGDLSGLIPRPRGPSEDSRPPSAGEPGDPPGVDLDHVISELTRVLVRTCCHGAWQENAYFLLSTEGGHTYRVGFGDPVATELVRRLHTLPTFDSDLLFGLIGCHAEELIVVWQRE
ncbi:MAG TPA: hypothetical protein VH008_16625 [Pseudonocardia sp.]|jgi:hypothetical protein|nr:hypothetical protein [Pseudonocardia sp.]